MVFLLFTSAFLFFKSYNFPFSGVLILGVTLTSSMLVRSGIKPLNPFVLLFPLTLCITSLWDGSSPEDILDLICLSLAGIISCRDISRFRGPSISIFREGVFSLLFACGIIFSYSKEEYSAFLAPGMGVLFLRGILGKKLRTVLLSLLLVASTIGFLVSDPSQPSEPSFAKAILLCSAIGILLFYGKEGEGSEKIIFLLSFLLVAASRPGPEFPGYTVGLFFSYLQEETQEPDSEMGGSSLNGRHSYED
ncbi:hypothetical protein LEP1GSC047_4368 [Leptospira inadai serovar Lyme str. 10]|uniref:Uncharacterized protein n=2 Tax=Leptospira inadai serovar Lyme TaxID=293084 RepID=V6HDT0_9LEPT|nr:hypothetical protein [Leptospira inadai]EQA38107.1 hypothetical protein LEP1GSC047_4368 [Leptospira inadai serovar Lyme str. 10]PNV72790.1 hypothetical protein BES34_018660 [Leptospira inadai serovar Lyme]